MDEQRFAQVIILQHRVSAEARDSFSLVHASAAESGERRRGERTVSRQSANAHVPPWDAPALAECEEGESEDVFVAL